MGRQMTDTTKSRADGCRSSIKNTQNEDTGGQSPAHTSGRNAFRPSFVYLNRSAATVKSGGHLGRAGFHFQFENVCDRSEDGLASMVALLAVRLGQPARLLGKLSDPAGLEATPIRWILSGRFHFSISSSKGKRVKNSWPLSVISKSHSNRTVCSSLGWPANVSTAKYILGLISAGYFRE